MMKNFKDKWGMALAMLSFVICVLVAIFAESLEVGIVAMMFVIVIGAFVCLPIEMLIDIIENHKN